MCICIYLRPAGDSGEGTAGQRRRRRIERAAQAATRPVVGVAKHRRDICMFYDNISAY